MIRSVSIKNWKAFADPAPMEFRQGLNLFVGQNGSGKTSLLEAICLALVGRCSIDAFEELAREPQKDAVLSITFAHGESEYRVARSFGSGRKRAELVDLATHETVSTWEGVTDKVCDILGVDVAFFHRLIYMSEGEVQRCVSDPPQKPINNQIRVLSGQVDVETLREENQRLSRAVQKQIDDGESQLAHLQDVLEPESSKLGNLNADLAAKKRVETESRERLGAFDAELRTSHATEERILTIDAELQKLQSLAIVEHILEKQGGLTIAQLQVLRDRFHASAHEQESTLSRISAEIGAATANLSNLRNIRTLLDNAMASAGTASVCPVCKRPIDEQLAQTLSQEINDQLVRAEMSIAALNDRQENETSSFNRLQSSIEQLTISADRITNSIRELPENLRSLTTPLETVVEALRRRKTELQKLIQDLNEQLSHLRAEIEPLEKQIASLAESQKRLQLKKTLEKTLVGNFRRQMILNIINGTLTDVLHSRQQFDMEKVYEEIATMWNRFRPGAKWRFSIDAHGSPILFAGNKRLSYSHLSGGEKTILLVLIRTILIKQVTKLDFLLIDEPLEHLDSRNRRSLLNFLYGITEAQIIPQVVITTFEDTLTRRFYDQKGVTLNYLGTRTVTSVA